MDLYDTKESIYCRGCLVLIRPLNEFLNVQSNLMCVLPDNGL